MFFETIPYELLISNAYVSHYNIKNFFSQLMGGEARKEADALPYPNLV